MTSGNPSDRSGARGRANRWLALPVGAVAGMLGAAVAARRLMRRPVPKASGRLVVEGLNAPVEIIRDKWGVPHIRAANEPDLFFAQGFVHAQERLFQMDLNRRLGLGRLAEIIGPAGVPFDKFARYLGWPRVVRAQVDGTDVDTAAVLAAYAAGVNACIAGQPLPAEFKVLAYRPEPWDATATSAWGVVLAWGLSCNWETELLRAWLLDELGPERAADLTPVYREDYPTILPGEQAGRRLAEGLLRAFHNTVAEGPVGMPLFGHGLGSNNWVVAGSRTASGRPHLANDPHLPPVFPTIWYANHLAAPGFNVAGFTLPGVPGIVIGHNEHCAWGVTNAFPDVQDVYIERFDPEDPARYEVNGAWRAADVTEEIIKVRGWRDVKLNIRSTHRGPVFSDILPGAFGAHADLSYDWAMFHGGNHMRAVIATNRATDWPTFRDSLRHWTFPPQNVVYAGTDDTIAYMMPGLVPKRRTGDGLSPVPGWTDGYDWDGFIPFEELPVYLNPPEGYLATANNCMAGDNYPHLLTGEWMPDYRIRRIRELLDAAPELSLEDQIRIQTDVVSLMARRFLAVALPAVSRVAEPDVRPALDRLSTWDGTMSEDSVSASVCFGWLVNFTRAVAGRAVGDEKAATLYGTEEPVGFPLMPFYEIGYELALHWLEAADQTGENARGMPAWIGDVRPLLLPALRQTLETLRKDFGREPERWAWGRLHRVTFEHEMARLPGIGRLWKPVAFPVPGDGYTINQSDVPPHFPPEPSTIIASCRLIIDVGEWDNSMAALPGGQSGHPASPHYQDRLAEWREGRYFPLLFSREKVLRDADGTWTLLPKAEVKSRP